MSALYEEGTNKNAMGRLFREGMRVMRANLDGSQIETLVETSANGCSTKIIGGKDPRARRSANRQNAQNGACRQQADCLAYARHKRGKL
jgi:hypothetical protein